MAGLRLIESVLIITILVQSVAIVFVYEGAFSQQQAVSSAGGLGLASVDVSGDNTTLTSLNDSTNDEHAPSADHATTIDENGVVRHTTTNPGGLILAASFSYMQDPREVHRKKPLPHILPTYENMYHFQTTVHQQKLHAIIFHDDYSFNQTFVKKHTSEYVKFIRIEAPTFDHGEPVISPNDFRYVVFNNWIKANSEQTDAGVMVNGINYGWYMISDLDMFFQRNPFKKMDEYANRLNLTFFGSWDGGMWEAETMRLQRMLFRNW